MGGGLGKKMVAASGLGVSGARFHGSEVCITPSDTCDIIQKFESPIDWYIIMFGGWWIH